MGKKENWRRRRRRKGMPGEGPRDGESVSKKKEIKVSDPVVNRNRAIFRNLLIAAATLSILAGALHHFSKKSETRDRGDKPVPTSTNKPAVAPSNRESETDKLIARAEQAFAQFERKVMPLIDSLEDESMKEKMKIPFQVMRGNLSNPTKNILRMREGTSSYDPQNPHRFQYLANENLPDYAFGGFDPMTVSLILSPNFDPNKLGNLLTLYHELFHVYQHSRIKQGFRSQEDVRRYRAFYRSKQKKSLLDNELDAHSHEIELYNLLTGGELKKAAEEGREVNVELVAFRLGVNVDPGLVDLLLLSQVYYPGGMQEIKTNLRCRFTIKLATRLREVGYKGIYKRLPDGRLVDYFEHVR